MKALRRAAVGRFSVGGFAVSTFLATVGLTISGAALAGPAAAEVTITPTEAAPGEGVNVTFRVPDDRGSAYTTRLDIQLPQDNPIAEVYPLSVPDWGPKTTNRTLDKPVQGIHGTTLQTITVGITWLRVVPPTAGGSVSELTLAMGPMPNVDRLALALTQTYSDGVVRRWNPVISLRAAPAAGASPGASDQAHGGGHAAGATPAARQETGSGSSAVAGYVIAGVAGALVVVLVFFVRAYLRQQRREESSGEPDAPDERDATAETDAADVTAEPATEADATDEADGRSESLAEREPAARRD